MYDAPFPFWVMCSAFCPRACCTPSMTGMVPVTVHVFLSSVPLSKSSQRSTFAVAQRLGPKNFDLSFERSRPPSDPPSRSGIPELDVAPDAAPPFPDEIELDVAPDA